MLDANGNGLRTGLPGIDTDMKNPRNPAEEADFQGS